MRRDGFTLIEMLVATVLISAALTMIWGAWISANDTAEVLDRKMTGTAATAQAMARIARELRPASRNSISALPAGEVTYRIPEDLDGNGLAVDAAGAPEWGSTRRIGRDHQDANSDGFTVNQLVLQHDGVVEVLATGLTVDETEDNNQNGRLDFGFWVEAQGQGVQVTIRTVGKTRRNLEIPAAVAQQITPRNP